MTDSARLAARNFTDANLPALAGDVLHWHKNASLPQASLAHDLAKLCSAYASPDDEYQEAERLIIATALQAAAGHNTDDHVHPCADAEHEQGGYNRLLPKLLAMADTVDSMSDEAYTAWINTLQEDEFFAFIAVSHNKESFRAAINEAKRRTEVTS